MFTFVYTHLQLQALFCTWRWLHSLKFFILGALLCCKLMVCKRQAIRMTLNEWQSNVGINSARIIINGKGKGIKLHSIAISSAIHRFQIYGKDKRGGKLVPYGNTIVLLQW